MGWPDRHAGKPPIAHVELHPVPGTWTLEVVNTCGSGLRTTLRLRGDALGARQAAEEILSAYSTPYRIDDPED